MEDLLLWLVYYTTLNLFFCLKFTLNFTSISTHKKLLLVDTELDLQLLIGFSVFLKNKVVFHARQPQ